MPNYKVVVSNVRTCWYNEEDKFHRENGPAIEYANGEKQWWINGKFHREDGPAIEYPDGSKYWYKNDKLHREDGPAIEYPCGRKFWYLNNKELTEAEHQVKVKSCDGKTVTINGKTYKLTLVD